jgi:hypothetical protein
VSSDHDHIWPEKTAAGNKKGEIEVSDGGGRHSQQLIDTGCLGSGRSNIAESGAALTSIFSSGEISCLEQTNSKIPPGCFDLNQSSAIRFRDLFLRCHRCGGETGAVVMSSHGLEGIDHSAQQAHIWINDLERRLGWDSKPRAYRLLKAVLQTLRDRSDQRSD